MKYDTQMRLAANLKQLRITSRYSQAQLAGMLHLDRSVVALYESGRRTPDPEVLYEISLLYGISMETLLAADLPKLLQEAAGFYAFEKGEQELVCLYRRLSSFSRGRLLEKAEDLLIWDAACSRK